MKHPEMEKIASFSKKKMEHKIFNDEDLDIQQHMIECNDCYQKMCLYVMLWDMTEEETIGALLHTEMETQGIEKESLVKKRAVGYILAAFHVMYSHIEQKVELVQEYCAERLWEFRKPTALAAVRGDAEKENIVFCPLESPKSYIRIDEEQGKIYIFLEASDYPEDAYELVVIAGKDTKTYEIVYDEDEEIYEATVDCPKNKNDIRLEIRCKE